VNANAATTQPFVVIRPEGLAFHFNDGDVQAAERMADRLNAVIEEFSVWNQPFFGLFASVEMREVDPDE